MAILGCSSAKAYSIMRTFNEEMKAQGYYTVAGKVNSQYFRDKFKIEEKEIEALKDLEDVKKEVRQTREKNKKNL